MPLSTGLHPSRRSRRLAGRASIAATLVAAALLLPAAAQATAGLGTPDPTFSRDTGRAVAALAPEIALSEGNRLIIEAGAGSTGGYVAAIPLDGNENGAVTDIAFSQALPSATNPPVVAADYYNVAYAYADDTAGLIHLAVVDPLSGNLYASGDVNVGGNMPPKPVALRLDQSGNLIVVADARRDDPDGGGGHRWAVAKFARDGEGGGPDPAFGDDDPALPGVAAGPWTNAGEVMAGDLLPSQAIVLTGRGAFTGADAEAQRVHVLQLTAAGHGDPTFGTVGIAQILAGGGTGATPIETATDIHSDPSGDLELTGTIDHGAEPGFAAKLDSDGRPVTGFGSGGVARLPAINFPEEIEGDGSGASYVLGQGDGYVTSVTSLTSSGTTTPGYGLNGIAKPGGCTENARSFVTTQNRLVSSMIIDGTCPSSSDMGLAQLIEGQLISDVRVYADTGVSGAVPAAGRVIPLDQANIPPTPAAATTDGASLASAPLRGSPLRGSPLRGSPLRGSPLRGSPLRGSPLRGSPLRGSPLTSIPLRGSGGWTAVLAGTPLANRPLQTVTLADVLALVPAVDVSLGDIDLVRSPLRDVPLGALLLLGRPLSALPPPSGGWCAFLVRSGATPRCGSGVDLDVNTLLDLSLLGVNLRSYLAGPIPLTAAVLGSGDLTAPIAQVAIDATNLVATALSDVRVDDVADLVNCDRGCPDTVSELQDEDPSAFGDATLADLVGILRSRGRIVTLQDLLPGLVEAGDLPLDDEAILAALRARAPQPDESNLIRGDVEYRQGCSEDHNYEVHIDSGGMRYVPGSGYFVSYTEGGPDRTYVADATPDADGKGFTFDHLADGSPLQIHGCYGDTSTFLDLQYDMEPTGTLGIIQVNATVTAYDGPDADPSILESASSRSPATVEVEDDDDPGATAATAKAVDPGTLYSEYIPAASDVDAFRFAAPAAGSVVTVSATGLPSDDDLYVQGPRMSLPLPAGEAARQQSTQAAAITDASSDPQGSTTSQPDGTSVPISPAALAASPLRGASTHRGDGDESVSFLVQDSDAGSAFVASIAGFDGATSNKPYALRVTVTPPAPTPQCISRTITGGTVGTYPTSIPATTQTLIVYDRQRTEAIYGAAATTAMIARLQALATTAGVNGVVLPVDGHPTLGAGVRAAYARWDATPCSPGAANDTVAAVDGVIANASRGLTALRNVVLIGADDVLPQARIPDLTGLSNERDDADQLTVGGKDTPTSRALRTGNVLSDDPYGDLDPQAWLGGTLSVPDLALGRLVETPADVVAQINRFITNGAITPTSARATGYDFLSDGATSILASMKTTLGGTAPNASGLINETWTAADARTILGRTGAGLTSVNAHYDQYRLLPAAAFNGNSSELVSATQTSPAAGSLLFTIGCHAGLSVVDRYAAGVGVPADQLLDWAQRTTQTGSLFVGNTGFGYGDRGTVAYSEKLMADFAAQVSTKTATIGQSLMYAKQKYFASLSTPSVYDSKSLNEATFYGLPMYKVTSAGLVGAPALPPAAASGAARKDTAFSVSPVTTQQTTDRGSFWTADGRSPIVAPQRPIQPKTDLDVTPTDGLQVHGALIEALTSRDIADVNPINALPTIDQSAREPEPVVAGAVFPATLARVDAYGGAAGRRSLLNLAAGQFIATSNESTGTGTQRLYSKISGRVFRSGSADEDAPRIGDVTGDVAAGSVAFTVRTPDDDTIGGLALYLDGTTGTWKSAPLAKAAGGTWGGAGAVTSSTTNVPAFFVQLYDAAGNVAASTGKGGGYVATPPAAPAAGAPALTIPGPPGTGGYYRGPVEVTLADPSGNQGTFLVSTDGATAAPYTGPFEVSGDGIHTIVATSTDGRSARSVIRIDSAPPVVTITPDREPDHRGFYTGPVTLTFTCSDAVSGLATACPPPKRISGEGRYQKVNSGTITDRAGNSTSATFSVSLDFTTPAVTINPIPSGTVTNVVSGTATDAISGMRDVILTINGKLVPTIIRCTDAERKNCTWTANSPIVGTVTVKALGQDLACNADVTKTMTATLKLGKQ